LRLRQLLVGETRLLVTTLFQILLLFHYCMYWNDSDARRYFHHCPVKIHFLSGLYNSGLRTTLSCFMAMLKVTNCLGMGYVLYCTGINVTFLCSSMYTCTLSFLYIFFIINTSNVINHIRIKINMYLWSATSYLIIVDLEYKHKIQVLQRLILAREMSKLLRHYHSFNYQIWNPHHDHRIWNSFKHKNS
jgi:hypothetical protein